MPDLTKQYSALSSQSGAPAGDDYGKVEAVIHVLEVVAITKPGDLEDCLDGVEQREPQARVPESSAFDTR